MSAALPTSPSPSPLQEEALQALLIDCLHSDSNRPHPDALRRLDAASWTHMGELALQVKVIYPVYQRLQQPSLAPLVPEILMSRLSDLAKLQARRQLKIRATLVELLRASQEAGLPVLVLKGAHVAETYYPKMAARAFSDIDLLIKPDDLIPATALFKRLGFQIPHNVRNLQDLAPTCHEYTLIHSRWGTPLDVHWSLAHQDRVPNFVEAGVWARAKPLTLAGAPALGMALEDLLLYLCFHASHHHHFSFVGLRPLLDITMLCAAEPGPDWSQVVSQAREWRWHRGIYLTLWLARDLLGAEVPQAALAELLEAPGNLESVRNAALEAVFKESNPEQGVKPNILRLWTANSLAERLAILLERMLPPRAKLIQELGLDPHRRTSPLAWLRLRWIIRLFSLYGGKLWALSNRDPIRLAEIERRRRLVDWLEGAGK